MSRDYEGVQTLRTVRKAIAPSFSGANAYRSRLDEWRWACMSAADRRDESERRGPTPYGALRLAPIFPDPDGRRRYADDNRTYSAIIFKYHIPVVIPGVSSWLTDQEGKAHITPFRHGSSRAAGRTWPAALGTTATIQASTFIPVIKFPREGTGWNGRATDPRWFDNDR